MWGKVDDGAEVVENGGRISEVLLGFDQEELGHLLIFAPHQRGRSLYVTLVLSESVDRRTG